MLDCSYLLRSSARCDHGVSSMSGSNASDLLGKSPEGRRLIAVVYADMVGYSRLIGFDDVGTLERLRTLRRNVIDPAIEEHGGRIVQTGGDSLLIVFDSIDGAARCAVRVQQQVLVYDGDQPAEQVIRFRIGINIGDAIADGTDLHGDAVISRRDFRPNVHRAVSALQDQFEIMCKTGSILPLRSLAHST
jgi:class 3 adenylate cyclase